LEVSIGSVIAGNFSELLCICRLDVGDGKDVDLPECPRTLLKKQCIRYLGPVRNVLLWMAIYLKIIYIMIKVFQEELYKGLMKFTTNTP